jgi:hypothetical protein
MKIGKLARACQFLRLALTCWDALNFLSGQKSKALFKLKQACTALSMG